MNIVGFVKINGELKFVRTRIGEDGRLKAVVDDSPLGKMMADCVDPEEIKEEELIPQAWILPSS